MKKRLGEILLERQLLTVEQLNIALAHQRQWSMRLGAALVAKGFITERALTGVLSQSLGIPLVDLSKIVVDRKALSVVPVELCEQHDYFPIAIKQQKGRPYLLLAMADPLNFGAIDELAFRTGCKVQPAIAQLSSVGQAIRRFYYDQLSVTITPLDGENAPLDRSGKPVITNPKLRAAPPANSAPAGVAAIDLPPPVFDGAEWLAEVERPALGGPGRAPSGSFLRAVASGNPGDEQLPLLEAIADSDTGTFAIPVGGIPPPVVGSPAAPQEAMSLKALAASETESLEEKFWALMQILNARGVVTKEEFLNQLRQRK